MSIINKIMAFLVGLLDTLLPSLGVSDELFLKIDSALDFFISLLQGASYFIPLDVLVFCLGVMILVDNFSFLMRFGTFILKLIRG